MAQGWNQVHGIDCGSTFAPVCLLQSERMLCGITVAHGMDLEHVDVSTALFNADINEEMFVEQAPGFEVKGEHGGELVMKLHKRLYGPGNWCRTIDPVLVEIGFKPLKSDTCV